MSHRRASHWQPWVPGIRLLHGIDRQETDRVDRFLHKGRRSLLQRLHGGSADRGPRLAGRCWEAPAGGERRGGGVEGAAGEVAEAESGEGDPVGAVGGGGRVGDGSGE